MHYFIREIAISIAKIKFPSIKLLEKVLSLFILSRDFSKVFLSKKYNRRRSMWVDNIKNFCSSDFIYLEFGVWQGSSIKYISNKFMDNSNQFFGFDSFIGLPEDWDTMTKVVNKSSFSVNGIIPKIKDKRVKFVKGWFQNTLPNFITDLSKKIEKPLVVHYDADLYSSTLFCLIQVDRLKVPYLAIFDEFPGHETRALYNYIQITGAKVEFIGRVSHSLRYPLQVTAVITPCDHFKV